MKSLFVILFLFLSLSIFGQSDLNFCGTTQGRSTWLKNFQHRPSAEKSSYRVGDIIFVPLTIHLVARDDGKAAFGEDLLLKTMCNLNDVFLSSDMQFYIYGDIVYHNSSAMFDHSTTNAGGEFMLEHNVENSLNCYVVSNPAGNCGYNLPWAGVALGKSCMGKTDLTWAHEIGHALSLPHPFLGWEGGVAYDGSEGHSFNDPAPEFVTYNYTEFKDVQYKDTLIIDTAYVELVDGSNCHIAADGFCDTKPDYLASRWGCNTDGFSDQLQTDPSGTTFQSDGRVLMAYSSATNHVNNKCMGIFTPEQSEAMRANLVETKPEWLDQEAYAIDGISNEVINEYPSEEEKVDFRSVELSWELASGDADKYIIQIALGNNMSFIFFDSIVSQQSMTIHTLDNNKKYYWWVRAIDNNEVCSEYNVINAFETADLSSVNNIADDIISVYPTLLNGAGSVYVEFENTQDEYGYELADRNGRLIKRETKKTSNEIAIQDLSSGVYFLKIINKKGSQVFKIVSR